MSRGRWAEGINHVKHRYSRAPGERVKRPERALVWVLERLNGWQRKHYSFPSQEKIRELARRWCGIRLSRRQLNRHLNALHRDLWITRTRRLQYHKRKGLLFRSTLYHLGARHYAVALRQLKALAASLAGVGESSRVPKTAQYLRIFLEDLICAPSYPQPRTLKNRSPGPRG